MYETSAVYYVAKKNEKRGVWGFFPISGIKNKVRNVSASGKEIGVWGVPRVGKRKGVWGVPTGGKRRKKDGLFGVEFVLNVCGLSLLFPHLRRSTHVPAVPTVLWDIEFYIVSGSAGRNAVMNVLRQNVTVLCEEVRHCHQFLSVLWEYGELLPDIVPAVHYEAVVSITSIVQLHSQPLKTG